jgi:predicted DNA-binding protein (MmcQ/YjbR family)
MTRQEIIDFCLIFPAAYEDYPFVKQPANRQSRLHCCSCLAFADIKNIGVWTVMRHSANKKTFAYIYERHGKLCVNLKCDPVEADFLRSAFADVQPGYHMNKTHWNTVIIGGDVPDEELKRQIEHSYDLIKPKIRKRKGAKQ